MMNIFQQLGKTKKNMFRYGLTNQEVVALESYHGSEGWKAYLKLLSNYAEFQGQTMLHCSDDAALHCARGQILGLQAGPMLVDSIIQGEKIRNEREQQSERTDTSGASRIGALWGTSLWPGSKSGI